MRLIPTRVHGIIDYLMGIVLIAAPWIFDFSDGGAKTWVPVILGLGTILYSLMTDYELGVARVIPMPAHLLIDVVAGAFLAISPWLFGFSDEVMWPHVILGLLEIGVAAITERHPAERQARLDRTSHV